MSHRLHVESTTKPAERGAAARLDADRKGLSPFGRISSPSLAQVVRQVHGGDHRLELHPNGLVAYALDFEIGSTEVDWALTR